jgi:hypothetical protein
MDFTLIERILGRSRVSRMNHFFEIVDKAAQPPLKNRVSCLQVRPGNRIHDRFTWKGGEIELQLHHFY